MSTQPYQQLFHVLRAITEIPDRVRNQQTQRYILLGKSKLLYLLQRFLPQVAEKSFVQAYKSIWIYAHSLLLSHPSLIP
ncbi:hypothetical protein [Anabaena lutea]|uniref:Transposase n=1 Tax=Anabaena lutea FACHB-196 TaxID=2692881 RepID=A0ABR8FP33_9NOST|nr:hypothetical protein [Anabaena lutea]MBD2571313.1 hypothetical protein [Anabaena lutea FACHB-196]